MIADEQEDYVVLELKKDAVLKSRADFPVVPLPVLEAESFGQRRQTVKIVHESINSVVRLLLPCRRQLLEPAVKAGLELVSHCYFIIFLRCSLADWESGKLRPFSSSTRARLAASFS